LHSKGRAPVLIHFIARIAARFEIEVSKKSLAQSVPGISTVTGAAINAIFSGHFNSVARFHFGMHKSERIYGE
jgi:hypothetical protein